LRVASLIPALLALVLLVVAAVRIQLGSRRDVGLLKALGWTTAEIARHQLFRALVIALPATAIGWAAAYALVFVWRASWAGVLLFGWTASPPPQLTLDPAGALLTLLLVGGLVLAPWLAAVLLPTLRSAVTDPEQWLRGEEGS
jgi:cell division protein FtsX